MIKFFVRNNDQVKKNEILGWIESTANHSQVLKLSKQLDTSLALLKAGFPGQAGHAFNEICTNLGELQPAYQNFNTALSTFNDYLENGYYYRKKKDAGKRC
jgi:HlyD family secretion protein